MPWTNTNSSIIRAYDYDPAMKVLHLHFASTGEIRSYQDVPPELAAEFIAAPSKGKFFHNRIRDEYHGI